jgi:hypothetical protein
MVSSSEHHPSAYDPYASAYNTSPPNVATQGGSGQLSSNLASFQSVDNTLLADYMRQAEEVSRMFHLLQQDMQTRSHNPLPPPNAGPPSSTWVHTPTLVNPPPRPDSISSTSDLIDLYPSVGLHSAPPNLSSQGSSQYIGYPFSPPVGNLPYPPPGRPDTNGFPASQSSIRSHPSRSGSLDEGHTKAYANDRLNISAFLHQPSASSYPSTSPASTPMPSLTTPISSPADPRSPTLADAIAALELSDAVPTSWVAASPDETMSSLGPSHVSSGITVPQAGRHITRATLHPSDRGAYARQSFPNPIPIASREAIQYTPLTSSAFCT